MNESRSNSNLPEAGAIVAATLRNCHKGNIVYAILVKVDESDCDWRVYEDVTYPGMILSELSHSFDVEKWVQLNA